MMMYKYRGVLPQSAIAPVYTFGAPAIFCEGVCCAPCSADTGLCSAEPTQPATALQAQPAAAAANTSATEPVTDNHGHAKSQGILQALGLEAGSVRNIFMSRDIVPRAFACDYTLVADLLRRVGEGFREHGCLAGEGRSVPVHASNCISACSLHFNVQILNFHPALETHEIWCASMFECTTFCGSCLDFWHVVSFIVSICCLGLPSLGHMSAINPCIVIAICIFVSFTLAHMSGLPLGMLITLFSLPPPTLPISRPHCCTPQLHAPFMD